MKVKQSQRKSFSDGYWRLSAHFLEISRLFAKSVDKKKGK